MGGLGSFFGGGDSPEKTNVLASLLQSNDIGSLQSSYNDLITKAISGPSRSEPDNQALMFQVAIPTILAGLLGGKRGLAASAEPVGQAYMRELERSKEAQKQNQARDLTAAELVGKRINDVQDTFEKAAALEEKHAIAKEQIQSREEIAGMNNETRQMMLAGQAEQRAYMNQLRNESAQRQDENADDLRDTRLDAEADRVRRGVEARIKPWRESLKAAEDIQHALADPTGPNVGMIRGGLAQLAQGGSAARISDKDVKVFAPPNTAQEDIAAAADYITGNYSRELSLKQINVIRSVVTAKVDYIKQKYGEQLKQFEKGLDSSAKLHKRLGRESELRDILIQAGYPGMDEIGGLINAQSPPPIDPTIPPGHARVRKKDGTIEVIKLGL